MEGKRYYWLKLHDDFFSSKRIKKLRKMAGGDTYTIIYLKMQLIAMKNDGVLKWTRLEQNIAAELALDLDEEEDNVAVTLSYLLSCGLAETDDDVNYFFPYSMANTGSETASTQRSRECRARQKMLQCNTNATALQHERNKLQQTCSVEIEKEIEKEIDITITNTVADTLTLPPAPTLKEIEDYCRRKNLKVNPKRFFDTYSKRNWCTVEGKPIDDWYSLCEHWDKTEIDRAQKDKPKETGSFDTDDFFEAALERSYGNEHRGT